MAALRSRTLAALGAVLLAVALWLVLLGPSFGPWERTPGFLLLGETVDEPVDDWEFVRAHPEIAVETRTRWLVPHSVTTSWLLLEGELFIPARDAAGKLWVRNALRDPRVRVRIGDRLYAQRLVRVEDPELHERLVDRSFQRWPQFERRGVRGSAMGFFRVDPL